MTCFTQRLIDGWHFCRHIRRNVFEHFNDYRYSRPASANIDQKLEKYLEFSKGFFVEAGANDGYLQSNTYYLEKRKEWHGVLIEPVPELAKRCVRQRRRSQVINSALVDKQYTKGEIQLHYFNAMSYAEGAFSSLKDEFRHTEEASKVQRIKRTYSVIVPARTLTSILRDTETPKDFDFLSLDVEGYEAQALSGLDFDEYRPRYILIEVNDRDGIDKILSKLYEPVEALSERDVLYRLKELSEA